MVEPARLATITQQHARKKSNDLLVRRLTTAMVSVAICLTGLFTGLAAVPQLAGRAEVRLDSQPGDPGAAALVKALGDYEAAVAAQHPAAVQAPAPAKAPTPAKVKAAPTSRPVAVTGGS